MFDNEGVAPEYINEQYADTVITVYPGVQAQMKDIGFGSFGNIAANGCGVIAAYNVIVAKEKRQIEYTVPTAGPKVPTSFGQVRDDLQQQGAPLLDGILGAGVYSSTLQLGNAAAQLQVTVDADHINAIELINLDEAVTTMYPLMEPCLDELTAKVIDNQGLENISYSTESRYTSILLLNAISQSLSKAAVSTPVSDTMQ